MSTSFAHVETENYSPFLFKKFLELTQIGYGASVNQFSSLIWI